MVELPVHVVELCQGYHWTDQREGDDSNKGGNMVEFTRYFGQHCMPMFYTILIMPKLNVTLTQK